MFGSRKQPETTAPSAQPAPSVAPRKASEITEGLNVSGDLDGDGDVKLDGRLEGNIRCRALTIGKTGELIGRVEAQEVTVFGVVHGNIRATQVKLESTARVDGDVVHDVLEVAAGAKIEGRYSRGGKLEKKPSADVPKDFPPRAPIKTVGKSGNGQRPQVVGGSSTAAAAKSDA